MRKALMLVAILGLATAAYAGYNEEIDINWDPTHPRFNGGGNFGGGPFEISNHTLGFEDAVFTTFCAERAETFNPGRRYYAQVNMVTEQTQSKQLNAGAAWLYRQFRAGTLANFDYSGNTPQDQKDLQNALWVTLGWSPSGAYDDRYEQQMLNVVANPLSTNPADLYNVRILNLQYRDANTGAPGALAQDMFVIIPIPGAALLGALGLSVVAAIKRRYA
jgi:hypothetical protein